MPAKGHRGIHLFGSDYHQAKRHVTGTHRSRSPEETIQAYLRFAPRMGITRLANVTGLDFVGLPVYVAVRPNARSLAVAQGKGIDAASAKASALMESIELWHAEHIDRPLRYDSYRSLRRSVTVADVAKLELDQGRALRPELPMLWIEGYDLLSERPCWVPYEMVSLNSTSERHARRTFVSTSNGLASGNHVLEAVVHALCEVIERDATTLWFLGGEDDKATQVDPSTIDDRCCMMVLELLARAGLLVGVYDITSDLGVPAYASVIFDRTESLRPMGYFWGFGCHLSPAVALARALTEAVQCRLTEITGSREDIQRHQYGMNRDEEELRDMQRMIEQPPPALAFRRCSLATDTFEEDVQVLLAALRGACLESAVVVDLSQVGVDIPVVKVTVPGLEGAFRPGYVPMGRLRQRLSGP